MSKPKILGRVAFHRLALREFRRFGKRSDLLVNFMDAMWGVPWFVNMGKKHPRDFCLVRVDSYEKAMKCAEARGDNNPYAKLYDAIPNRRKFRILLDTSDILFRKTAIRSNHPGMAFADLCLTIEKACAALWVDEPESQRFYLNLIGFYVEGYWPCGWQGKYPHGRLIVY